MLDFDLHRRLVRRSTRALRMKARGRISAQVCRAINDRLEKLGAINHRPPASVTFAPRNEPK